jgi:nucleoside-diphosphate-sugar epimerase
VLTVTETPQLLRGAKILVTGATGQIGGAIAKGLAADNDVWCAARFSGTGSREQLEAAGVTTRVLDLADPDFREFPDDFDYLLHLAVYQGFHGDGQRSYDHAVSVNAEATGLLLSRFRRVRAALVMSTTGVYKPNSDVRHRYQESDPLGDAVSVNTPTYGISKITQEAVARFCSREFGIPLVIPRMNAAYGREGGLPAKHLAAILEGRTIRFRSDPAPYSPIFESDIVAQVKPLLAAASAPATIVNWGGDEVVTAQEWTAYLGELTGRTPHTEVVPLPGSQAGIALDVSKRLEITGPCPTPWRTGMRAMLDARTALR